MDLILMRRLQQIFRSSLVELDSSSGILTFGNELLQMERNILDSSEFNFVEFRSFFRQNHISEANLRTFFTTCQSMAPNQSSTTTAATTVDMPLVIFYIRKLLQCRSRQVQTVLNKVRMGMNRHILSQYDALPQLETGDLLDLLISGGSTGVKLLTPTEALLLVEHLCIVSDPAARRPLSEMLQPPSKVPEGFRNASSVPSESLFATLLDHKLDREVVRDALFGAMLQREGSGLGRGSLTDGLPKHLTLSLAAGRLADAAVDQQKAYHGQIGFRDVLHELFKKKRNQPPLSSLSPREEAEFKLDRNLFVTVLQHFGSGLGSGEAGELFIALEPMEGDGTVKWKTLLKLYQSFSPKPLPGVAETTTQRLCDWFSKQTGLARTKVFTVLRQGGDGAFPPFVQTLRHLGLQPSVRTDMELEAFWTESAEHSQGEAQHLLSLVQTFTSQLTPGSRQFISQAWESFVFFISQMGPSGTAVGSLTVPSDTLLQTFLPQQVPQELTLARVASDIHDLLGKCVEGMPMEFHRDHFESFWKCVACDVGNQGGEQSFIQLLQHVYGNGLQQSQQSSQTQPQQEEQQPLQSIAIPTTVPSSSSTQEQSAETNAIHNQTPASTVPQSQVSSPSSPALTSTPVRPQQQTEYNPITGTSTISTPTRQTFARRRFQY